MLNNHTETPENTSFEVNRNAGWPQETNPKIKILLV